MSDAQHTGTRRMQIVPDDVLVPFAEGAWFCEAGEVIWMWYCPGCKCGHWTRTTGKEPCWGWNGSKTKPTFTPSVKVTSSTVCHSFVVDGVIKFLDDCTHELKGQNVPMALNKDWI